MVDLTIDECNEEITKLAHERSCAVVFLQKELKDYYIRRYELLCDVIKSNKFKINHTGTDFQSSDYYIRYEVSRGGWFIYFTYQNGQSCYFIDKDCAELLLFLQTDMSEMGNFTKNYLSLTEKISYLIDKMDIICIPYNKEIQKYEYMIKSKK